MTFGMLQSGLWVALLLCVIMLRPSFVRLYGDFNINLSWDTRAVIQLPYVLSIYWCVALSLLIAWPLLNAFILHLFVGNDTWTTIRQIWSILTWAVPLVLLLGFAFALIRPLTMIIQNLSPGK